MSESILEQIAQWHAAALTEVTTSNGYHQTLVVSRPEEVFLDADTITDLTTVAALGACEADGAPDLDAAGNVYWCQTFDAIVYVLARGGGSVAVDNRITRIVGDIHQRIGTEMTAAVEGDRAFCGGLAYRIDLLPWEIAVDDTLRATVVNVPVAIAFAVQQVDPYTQT